MPEVRLGALFWNQYTDWPSLLEAGRRADRLGCSPDWLIDGGGRVSVHIVVD